MIRKIVVTNYKNETLEVPIMNSEESGCGFYIKSITGVGPVKANLVFTDIVTMDGAKFNTSRIGTRNIVLSLGFYDCPTIEDARLKTYKYFPVKKPIKFGIETDNRYVVADGYVESNEPNIFNSMESCQISILCASPYFMDGTIGNGVLNLGSGIQPLFEFDAEFDPTIIDPEDPEPINPDFIINRDVSTEVCKKFSKYVNDNKLMVQFDYPGTIEVGVKLEIEWIEDVAWSDVKDIKIFNLTNANVLTVDANSLKEMLYGHLPTYNPSTDTELTPYIPKGSKMEINSQTSFKSSTFYLGEFYGTYLTNSIFSSLNAIAYPTTWLHLVSGENTVLIESDNIFAINLTMAFDIYYEGI